MLKIEELYKQKEDIKKEIIEEIEGIIKANKNNMEALSKINDYEWLSDAFTTRNI